LQIEALQKKRNTADYVRVGGVSDALAAEACALAGDLLKSVRQWVITNHQDLLRA
jgi:NADH:ubiquinone oxidoreductase subunit D